VKGYKAKGKRLSNYVVAEVEELEPLRQPEPEQIADESLQMTDDSGNPEDVLAGIEIVSTQPEDPEQIVDDGQMSLF
jgi:topoisomerase-4 subunit A